MYPTMSINAPMINPIHGPSIHAPAAKGRPVNVISVNVESGIRKKDNTTPIATNIAERVMAFMLISDLFILLPYQVYTLEHKLVNHNNWLILYNGTGFAATPALL